MIETWVLAPGFPDYSVSDKGQIKNHKGLLSPVINKDGYRQCSLRSFGQKKNVVLHRLIAAAFKENPHNLPVVNHLDGNKLNNTADNLEWCTPKRNHNHAMDLGLINIKGENNPRCSLKDAEVVEIKELLKQGIGTRLLSNKYGVTRSAIQHIKKGRCRK